MNTSTLSENIRKLAPKFAPDSEDLKWFESELDRVATKALPRLIKKRFAYSLRGSGEPKDLARREAGSPSSAKPGAFAVTTPV